jgi:hypothetical protein
MTMPRVLLLLAAAAPAAFAAETPKATPAPAQPPAVQAPQAVPMATALGRLFFSPQERATIDEMRRRPVAVAAPAGKPLPPAPEYVMLNGVVRRSDGSTSIWLNDRMLQGRRTADGLEVTESKRTPGNVTVKVPQAGRSVDLRVGQQLDVTSGKVQERYQVAPRTPPPTASRESAGSESASLAPKPAPLRRSSRERELRDLIRDIESAPPERQEPAADARG